MHHASQTWSLTTKHKNTIEVCQRKMVRRFLGVSNTQAQEWSILKSAAQQASRSKRKWAGHVSRLHHTRWAHETTIWDPYRVREAEAGQVYQMGRLFQQTSGTTFVQSGMEVNGKCWATIWTQFYHSRGPAQCMSL
jgi:hypothetical protein